MLERVQHTSTPYLLVIDFRQLFGKVLTVGSASVELKGFASFGAVLHTLVQFLEDGDVGFFEDGSPIKGTTTCGSGACVVHVVHAVTDPSE